MLTIHTPPTATDARNYLVLPNRRIVISAYRDWPETVLGDGYRTRARSAAEAIDNAAQFTGLSVGVMMAEEV